MSETSNTAMLDLAKPRTVVLTQGNQTFALHCRRVMEADWLNYFTGIFVSAEQHGRERINVVDATTPRVALAESVLIDADGYKVTGGTDLCILPNWQRKIPLSHRLLLAETLADVRPSTAAGELTIEPEAEVVSLDATWSTDGYGAMTKLCGLKHILKTPTEEQHRRYAREGSRARVVGGSRAGKTVYPGANSLLAKLYDELILAVEGYCVDGSPLNSPDQIIREMDTSHKVMAAQELFAPQMAAELAGGDAE